MPSRNFLPEQAAFDWNAEAAVLVAGVDEAGRGPLAGPVVAAAVILDPARPIAGLADSKQLTAQRRESLFALIQQRAQAWCVAEASREAIDRPHILQATMLAMRRAVEGLAIEPARVLVDGNRLPPLAIAAEAIVKGDAKVAAISAASILAKVTRDHWCLELHARYSHYGFDRHKGYGTAEHLAALGEWGPCPEHRRSFAPVARAAALHGGGK